MAFTMCCFYAEILCFCNEMKTGKQGRRLIPDQDDILQN